MGETPDTVNLPNVFFPYAVERQKAVEQRQTQFVHYTNAEAAISIIQNQEVWLRKASCMNDYMEVEHGLECLRASYHGDEGTRLRRVLDSMYENISNEIAHWFDSMLDAFRHHTYLLCVSEHRNSEDKIGRLSMWRAYGKKNGVALVLNTGSFFHQSDLGAYTSPVAYLDGMSFQEQFRRLADGIEASQDALRSLGRDTVSGYVFHAFRWAALCTKHPGFGEELEWRVVYSPNITKSPYLIEEIHSIRGVPQTVYKIPLRNIPEANFCADIPQLLDRLIIGPAADGYARAMYDAFRNLLATRGVEAPEARIYISDIPLR